MIDADAHPLDWPPSYARTPDRERKTSRFKINFKAARAHLLTELRLMGAQSVVISTNVPTRNDGLPYARFAEPGDPGVAVYFVVDEGTRVICCDGWKKVRDNLRAIGLTIEAIRGMDRWKLNEVRHRVFSGFKALPSQSSRSDWWDVLEVDPDADWDTIKHAHRRRAFETHPDHGGSTTAFAVVQEAWQQAKEARNE